LRNLYQVGDDVLHHAATAAKRLAITMRDRLGCDGVNLLNACEPAAWQTVWHFHVHVIPRYENDPLSLPTRPRQAEDDELRAVAGELRG
jgi:histidine triad (HIT) family protein